MMKKRASLLISGITTAALVVTAIGSFAAWDTLTGSTTDEVLKVSVSNPVVLAVTETIAATPAPTTKLAPVPIAGDITDPTTRAQEITVGKFKASLKNTDKVASLKTTYIATITGGDSTLYDVKIFDGVETTAVDNTTGLTLTDQAKEFTVKVSVKANADETKLKADEGKELKVDINLTTAKTV